jgi:hypothetical protein
LSPEYLIATSSAHGINSVFSVPGTNKPEWTFAEAAQACRDLEDHVFAALLYSYAGATETYYRLRRALVIEAKRIITSEGLPIAVKRNGVRAAYIEDLCGMYLLEEYRPSRFRTGANQPNMRRILMGIEEHNWRRRISPVYEGIGAQYINWLSMGRAAMNRRIHPREDCAKVG